MKVYPEMQRNAWEQGLEETSVTVAPEARRKRQGITENFLPLLTCNLTELSAIYLNSFV